VLKLQRSFNNANHEVIMAMKTQDVVFWVVMLCGVWLDTRNLLLPCSEWSEWETGCIVANILSWPMWS